MPMKKQKTLWIVISLVIVIISIIFLSLKTITPEQLANFNTSIPLSIFTIIVALLDSFNPCNLFAFLSRYCPHCKEAIKILIPLIIRYNLKANFKTLDVINKDDLRTLNNLAITISGVPVLIINCAAYLGLKRQDQYAKLFATFYKKVKVDSQ